VFSLLKGPVVYFRLSLTQCKQSYACVDKTVRENLKTNITDQCDKYKLDQKLLFIPTVIANYGYKNGVSAIDMVHACSAILEQVVSRLRYFLCG